MGDRLQLERSLIDPIYPQSSLNEPIDLGRVKVRFCHNGKTYQETAEVMMRFVPDERLMIIIPPEESVSQESGGPMTADKIESAFRGRFHLDDVWDGKLELTERGVVLDVLQSSGGDGIVVFLPRDSVVTVTPATKDLLSAQFHLFNFPDFCGPESYILKAAGGWRVCGRTSLRAEGWNITIAATDKTDGLCEALKSEGGYVVTHVGEIRREDGSSFSDDQLHDLLRCLHAFLSFVTGRWAGLALPVGFDTSGKKAFEQWGLPKTASGAWHASNSWFDKHHGELLPQTFPGYCALWKHNLWHETLWKATYWYLIANSSNVDSGLILAQTALELLAWTYCVGDRRMVSPQAFSERGLCAADKLRILTSALGIPLALPVQFKALNLPLSGRGKWDDAMDAITGIRNTLVHPYAKTKPHKGSYYEAAMLSLWYLDLILLRLCRHEGEYANRLASARHVGAVELVPWTKA